MDYAIANSKIQKLEPAWAPFPGFSILFDGSSAQLKRCLQFDAQRVMQLGMDLAPMETPLLHTCHNWWAKAQTELNFPYYLWASLPFRSYHVTLWDGINAGNLPRVKQAHREPFQRFWEDFGKVKAGESFVNQALERSGLWSYRHKSIVFEFGKLAIHGHALVAELLPLKEHEDHYQILCEARTALNQQFDAEFGPGLGFFEPYIPHVTLAYAVNRDVARKSQEMLPRWNFELGQQSAGLNLRYKGFSLYAFQKMDNFYKYAEALE